MLNINGLDENVFGILQTKMFSCAFWCFKADFTLPHTDYLLVIEYFTVTVMSVLVIEI